MKIQCSFEREDTAMENKEVSEEDGRADCREKIDRMGSRALRKFMKSTEDDSMRKYAEARLPEVIEKENALRRERKAEREELKRKTAEEKRKREKRLKRIGNGRIQESLYEEFEQLERERQPYLTEERVKDKLLKAWRALLKIDFVTGVLHSSYYGPLSVDIVYLTDKNVLLFNGLTHDSYVYLPCRENARLCIITTASLRSPEEFYYSQKFWEETLVKLKREYWTPILSPFPKDFLRQFLSKYYLNYMERASEGKETTHIPKTDS